MKRGQGSNKLNLSYEEEQLLYPEEEQLHPGQTAKKMPEKGAEIEFIIEVTGLSIEEIEALKV